MRRSLHHVLAAGLFSLVSSASALSQPAVVPSAASMVAAQCATMIADDAPGCTQPKPLSSEISPVGAVIINEGWPEYLNRASTYKAMADAGFTYVTLQVRAGQVDQALKAIDIAHTFGLTTAVSDYRMLPEYDPQSSTLDELVDAYASHAGFGGFILKDEPAAQEFPALSEVVTQLRRRDPVHTPFTNLYPNYATLQQLGASSYEEYLSAAEQLRSRITVDSYNFSVAGDVPGYFAQLDSMMRFTQRTGTKTTIISQLTPFPDKRVLTEDELRFTTTQPMAFGVLGIAHFSYAFYGAGSIFEGESCVTHTGETTPTYDRVRRVFLASKPIRDVLNRASHEQTFMSGAQPDGLSLPESTSAVFVLDNADITGGLFKKGSIEYVLLANRDYVSGTTSNVCFAVSPQRLDDNNLWRPTGTKHPACGDGYLVTTTLDAGGAELFRWTE